MSVSSASINDFSIKTSPLGNDRVRKFCVLCIIDYPSKCAISCIKRECGAVFNGTAFTEEVSKPCCVTIEDAITDCWCSNNDISFE